MPHPLGSSRSHPAPQEVMSCPTCLPGWWTSRTGTRPCGGTCASGDNEVDYVFERRESAVAGH
ncbi:hypothetical protein EYF80_047170 [Liparis tanakae]|uniref:Uncharacterized protein n=1 Tax=Liparis tanakae TaxID=230148 RepID=A0A4Z2FPF1_9TELE|nr:hypothetical protein EYF80_047170 [Liparis tanakae]